MFCENTNNFKYHATNLNNTFFKYFSYKIDLDIITEYKICYIRSTVIKDIPFFTENNIFLNNKINNTYIDNFRKYFNLCIGKEVYDYIKNIKVDNKILIGIHIRSLFQKKNHDNSFTNLSIKERLIIVKHKLDKLYDKYNIFIATDTNLYLEYANNLFTNIFYLDNIDRINNEEDSIPQLNNIGFKLGRDILFDCLALSLCDTVFVSNSNIPIIIRTINPDVKMEEY